MSVGSGRASRGRAALYVVHALLGLWAVRAWADGPFHGEAIQDAANVLRLAMFGPGAGAEPCSPLYPALLGIVLALRASPVWVFGCLGVATSLAVLAGISALCRRLADPSAAFRAMLLYVLSGSVLAFIPQPLPVLLGTALLLWGSVALTARRAPDATGGETGGETAAAGAEKLASLPVRHALLGGALLAASVLTQAPLLLPALCIVAGLLRRETVRVAAAFGAALLVVALAAVALPLELWPAGAGLQMRLGNGGARSGCPDVRPGPALDQMRVEPVVAAWESADASLSADAWQVGRLLEECAEDPAGAFVTLCRKLYLFWQRTEIVEGADFRHGLSGMAPERLLLLSFGLIGPLALASLRSRAGAVRSRHGWRQGAVWWPVLGVLLANLAMFTSSRHRLPALPYLCMAAGIWLAARPRRPEWMLAAALGVVLNADLASRPLIWAGDGELQEGALLLSEGVVDPASVVLARAAQVGADPRAALLLGAAFDREVSLHGDLTLRLQAEAWYREALARRSLYPDAADALMRSLVTQGKPEEGLSFGQAYVGRDAWAGAARLSLASMVVQLGDKQGARDLLVEGNRNIALWAIAHNDPQLAQRCTTELLRLAARDPVLEALAAR